MSDDSDGSCSPAITLTGTGFPLTCPTMSARAHDSRYPPKAAADECSSECRTIESTNTGDSRAPVAKSTIAARLSRLIAALENSRHASSPNATPLAGTGATPTSRRTRPGAFSSTYCAATPLIECPITENVSQPSESAIATASAPAASMVNGAASATRAPYPGRSTNAYE
jgi:hypothetical protein